MKNPSHASERVLVAGGAGFIGAHLCRRLLGQGHQVVCLDNFQTGRRSNVEALAGDPNFSLRQHDVIDPLPLDIQPTRIYNLACAASPVHYQADPVHTLRTCVQGAYHLLELARRCGARILQASTSEIYGDPEVHPQPESYRGSVNCVGVRSCYDEGKRCAETLFSDYGRLRLAQVKIARIFNTYGPYMSESDGRVVSNLVIQALNGRRLTIYGDGSQTRAFCYVDDMVDGLQRLMDSPSSFRGPVNLGSPVECTISEIATCIQHAVGTKVDVEFLPLPPDDPVRRCPDILLARRHLGWEPRVSLEAGLQQTVSYFSGLVGTPVQPASTQGT